MPRARRQGRRRPRTGRRRVRRRHPQHRGRRRSSNDDLTAARRRTARAAPAARRGWRRRRRARPWPAAHGAVTLSGGHGDDRFTTEGRADRSIWVRAMTPGSSRSRPCSLARWASRAATERRRSRLRGHAEPGIALSGGAGDDDIQTQIYESTTPMDVACGPGNDRTRVRLAERLGGGRRAVHAGRRRHAGRGLQRGRGELLARRRHGLRVFRRRRRSLRRARLAPGDRRRRAGRRQRGRLGTERGPVLLTAARQRHADAAAGPGITLDGGDGDDGSAWQ